MAVIFNNAEGGTDNVTPSTGNTGGASGTACSLVTVGTNNSFRFGTIAAAGTLGYTLTFGATASGQMAWAFPSATRTVLRFYVRFAQVPSVLETTAWMRNATGNMSAVAVNALGKFQLQDATATAVAASVATNAVSAGVWYRVEFAITKGTTTSNGTLEYAYYLGDSLTPEFTYGPVSTHNTGTTDVVTVRLGRNTASTGTGTRYFDEMKASDIPSGWLGPASAVQPTGIASAEAFGTPVVQLLGGIAPSGIASAEAFGTAAVTKLLTVSPAGIASAQAFGTPVVTTSLAVVPAGIASAQALGTPVVTASLAVSPAGIASAQAFGAASIAALLNVSPSGIASAAAVGTPTLSSALAVSPSGIPAAEAFGTPVVTQSPPSVVISPAGIAGAGAFGTAAITTALTVTPAGIASAQAFGATVVTPRITVSPAGIPGAEAFGVPAAAAVLQISPAGIGTAEAFGSATIGGLLTIVPQGIPRGTVFGEIYLTYDLTISPAGIASEEAFGFSSLYTAVYGDVSYILPPVRHAGALGGRASSSNAYTRWEGSLG